MLQDSRSGGEHPRRREDDRLYEKIAVIIDSLEVAEGMDEKAFLGHVFESAFELIPEAEKGSLYTSENDLFRPAFARGYDFAVLSRLSFSRDEAFIDFTVDLDTDVGAYETRITGRDPAKFSPETLETFRLLGTLAGFTSLYAPINVEGRTVGLISLEKFDSGGYSPLSRRVLQFYARLISKFYAQRLAQDKETRRFKEIVSSLVSAIEVMDKYTEGHARRVTALAVALARAAGLPAREIADIQTAAILHDVGKLGIPSEILRKPSSLTDEEFALIKRHPGDARKILGEIGDFASVAELASLHHERYDGLGYPEGLAGDAVPRGAYVIGVADAFDAMTSTRSYREALSVPEALGIIRAEAGRQFHPELALLAVEVFGRDPFPPPGHL